MATLSVIKLWARFGSLPMAGLFSTWSDFGSTPVLICLYSSRLFLLAECWSCSLDNALGGVNQKQHQIQLMVPDCMGSRCGEEDKMTAWS